jgi:TolB-like protein
MTPDPIHLTILRKGDTHIVDLAEVGSLIPRSETQVDGAFLHDLATEISRLAAPGYGRRDTPEIGGVVTPAPPNGVLEDLRRVGGLIFSHLLTEPARERLRTADPGDLYLRLDEHLIHIPWELCFDGDNFLATKFRVGRQVITGAPIPRVSAERAVKDALKVLLVVDPTESLPEAGAEADLLCTLLDGVEKIEVSLLGGRQVRKIPLLAALQAHDIVHFAGHSHYDAENPSKSGWRLHEGVLTAEEMSKLHRPPLLVFSNSCQAGVTAEWENGYHYEGQAFGIGSAFLLAGVRNYIGTFWVVHDDESVLFATEFYRSVVAGLSLGEALLRARQAALAQHGGRGLTWASYMLYGDPAFVLLPAATAASVANSQMVIDPRPALTSATLQQGELHAPTERTAVSRLPVLRLLVVGGLVVGAVALGHELVRRSDVSFFSTSGRKDVSESPASVPRDQLESTVTVLPRKDDLATPRATQGKTVGDEARQSKAVGVMHFKALNIDPQLEWMREAIRDSFNSELSGASDLKVYAKEYLDFLAQKTAATDIEVANQLGIGKMISGSFLVMADTLRVEAHVVDVQSGVLEASDRVEGALNDFANLHRQLVSKIMLRLNGAAAPPPTEAKPTPPAPSLDTYKLLLEAEGETTAVPATPDDRPASPPALDQQNKPLSFFAPALGWSGAMTSTAWAQSPSFPNTQSEEEIRLLLERYRQAYEQKDLALLVSVYDTVTPTQREANAKYFQQTQNLRVTIRDVDIAITQDEAAVSYTREDQFVDAKTGQNAQLALRFTKFLVRVEREWKIASGKKEVFAPIRK